MLTRTGLTAQSAKSVLPNAISLRFPQKPLDRFSQNRGGGDAGAGPLLLSTTGSSGLRTWPLQVEPVAGGWDRSSKARRAREADTASRRGGGAGWAEPARRAWGRGRSGRGRPGEPRAGTRRPAVRPSARGRRPLGPPPAPPSGSAPARRRRRRFRLAGRAQYEQSHDVAGP